MFTAKASHSLTMNNNSTNQEWWICSCPQSRTAWRNPKGLLCPPVQSQPLPQRWRLLQGYWPHSPWVPLTDAEEALSATRALSDYTREDLGACFVQAFWLCHSPVTILLHLPACTALFPHTPSQWKSPLASSFRVNTDGKRYETPPWKTRPLNFLQKAKSMQSAAILHVPTLHGG